MCKRSFPQLISDIAHESNVDWKLLELLKESHKESLRKQRNGIFKDVDIYLKKVDGKLLPIIVSHDIDLTGIRPNMQDIKNKWSKQHE